MAQTDPLACHVLPGPDRARFPRSRSRSWREGGAMSLVRVNITMTDSVFDSNEVRVLHGTC